MFTLADFGWMISDRARLDAHAAALRRVVTPSSVVLDIGAGTGIMSLLACQSGARRVYAVDPSAVVQILVAAARDNGFADRIVVLQRRSTEVTLPERADVIVSDLRGVLPPLDTHFADLADARARLLAPGGRLVPTRDTLWAAVASMSEDFDEARAAWQSRPHGLDLSSAQPLMDHVPRRQRARPEEVLSEPVQWASLHYPTLTALAVRGAGACAIGKSGVAHGLLVWFDAILADDIGFSNAPGSDCIYGQMLFPWPEAVDLSVGDRVTFDVRADPIGGDYLWTWETEIHRPAAASGVTRFRQSMFRSFTPSAESLRRRARTFVPTLSARGAEVLEALEGVRAGRTVGELAARLFEAHPSRFPSLDHAQGFVAELVERYGA